MDTKTCPYCGEEIMATAKKCKHCGEWLDKSAKPSAGESSARNRPLSETKPSELRKQNKEEFSNSEMAAGCIVGGGIVILYWGILFAAILFVLHITVPSRDRMIDCVIEDAVSEVQNQADDLSSLFDDDVNMLTNFILSSDAAKQSIRETILQYNYIDVDEGLFWTNAYLHNANTDSDGQLVGFGIIGITIPFVLWEDLQLLEK